MKIKLSKLKKLIKKNQELLLLISTTLIVVLLMQAFNFIKEERKKHLFDILNNIYFEKTLENVIKNLDPKYINIEHKVSPGETFNNILPQHSNNSASAAALSRPISIKQTNTYAYMGGNWGNPVTSGTLAATPDVRCIGGFNIWPNASGMELRKWFQPSYLSIGFEDGVDELNDIGGDDYDAWLGWNGFSTNSIIIGCYQV